MKPWPERLVLLGHPLGHARSPHIQNAALRAEHPFSAAQVERVEVTFPQNWTAIMDDPSGATYAPATYAQATNNLRFCLALGLHGAGMDGFPELVSGAFRNDRDGVGFGGWG